MNHQIELTSSSIFPSFLSLKNRLILPVFSLVFQSKNNKKRAFPLEKQLKLVRTKERERKRKLSKIT
jgi:hypothetical protein